MDRRMGWALLPLEHDWRDPQRYDNMEVSINGRDENMGFIWNCQHQLSILGGFRIVILGDPKSWMVYKFRRENPSING